MQSQESTEADREMVSFNPNFNTIYYLRSKDGVALTIGGLYQDLFTDLGDGTYLLQLEIRVSSFQ